jgi:hypothetical protein
VGDDGDRDDPADRGAGMESFTNGDAVEQAVDADPCGAP